MVSRAPEYDRRMAGKVHEYDADAITITYDARRCLHAKECVRGLPRVFDLNRRVWIDATQASAEAIAQVVMRCPTGALHFRRKDESPSEAMPQRNELHVLPDGPLYVRGELEIRTSAGVVHETRAALCRCGASSNKPFCDNSHRRIGFRDAPRAGAPGEVSASTSGPLRVLPQSNGPCVMEGAFVVVDQEGAVVASLGPRVSLCRCGHSANKPFCDGSHQRAGFTAE
jgi:CDGSH-type Zn-finger protein/uncharacterized Fe-S cluster protein YjdI